MTTTIEEFRPRVRKGIAAIETHEPGATDRIDTDTLDLYSTSKCALAQAVGGGLFTVGRDKLGIPAMEDATAAYGFSTTVDENIGDLGGNYANLRDAWIIELNEHRTAKAAVVAD